MRVVIKHNVVIAFFAQHQMRKAQTDFIQNTVNRDIKENSKRFWSDIKSKRQEPTGVSPPFK
jgi:hypothetical protein